MYDTIIIGSGPAGMTAALYLARANLKVAVIEQSLPGGQMNNTLDIENYPGYVNISGPDLSMKMYESLDKFDVDYIYGIVNKIDNTLDYKMIYTDDNIYKAKTVVIATGSQHKLLGIKGENEFSGKGVSYCAVCDGAFFKDKDLIVVGGGDSALEEALYLTQFANSVTIVHRRNEFRAQKIIQDRVFNNKKIKILFDSELHSILGDTNVKKVLIKNKIDNKINEKSTDGVFIYVGNVPSTSNFDNLLITDKDGWILTDNSMATNCSGVYAIGDVRLKNLRQITTAVNDGAIVSQSIFNYLNF